MATKPALMNLPIETSDTGFYSGFSKDVTISAKILVSAADYLGGCFSRKTPAMS